MENTVQALQQVARFWRRKLELRVVGITGSVGKSTTKELIAEVLGQRYRTLKNPGNLNNEIGLPLTLLRLGEGYEVAVLEMGFYVPGEIALLCDIALPQVGVVTNVGTVHAERAGSQEAIARGKAELVQSLPASPAGVAILNYDDPWVREMASKTSAQVFFYGLDPRADIWADEVEGIGLEGIRFRLHYRNEVLSPAGTVDRSAFCTHGLARCRGWSGRGTDLAGDRGRTSLGTCAAQVGGGAHQERGVDAG